MADTASSPALLFEEPTAVEPATSEVVVHPLVLFSVLDHHTRRQEAESRVIGTLLGRKDGHRVIITNCFAVPHAERGDEVAIGKDFNKTMMALHMRTSRKEMVVGWYATVAAESTDLIADTSSLIHEFYAGEADDGDPVHLVIDTRLLSNALALRAYKSAPVLVGGEQLGNLFHELPLTIKKNEPETICLHEMIKGEKIDENEEPSVDALQVSMEKLHELLSTTLDYVDRVVDGRIPADPEVGRQIAETMAVVPHIRSEVFDRLFHDSLQDLLMVTYLSNITRTQLTIAEKLNASLGAV